MRKFKFRFEKVRAFRAHQEKEKQQILAQARRQEADQDQAVQGILEERSDQQARERKHLVGPVRPTRLSGYSRYYLRLKQKEVAGKALLRQLSQVVEHRREELLAAARQRKMYDKLEERHRERFRLEYARLTQKETDDIGQKIHWRSQTAQIKDD